MSKTEDLSYDLANKLAKEGIKYVFETAFAAEGIPGALATPYAKLYTEYAKRFFDIVRAARKYDAYWGAMVQATHEGLQHEAAVAKVIRNTPVPTLAKLSLGSALMAMADPASAAALTQERDTFHREVKTLVTAFDGLLSTTIDMSTHVSRSVKEIDQFLETDKPRNTLERAYGTGSLTTVRNDWCQLANELVAVSRKLCAHRDAWATLAQMAPSQLHMPATLNEQCAIF